jgi:hypothetical protein
MRCATPLFKNNSIKSLWSFVTADKKPEYTENHRLPLQLTNYNQNYIMYSFIKYILSQAGVELIKLIFILIQFIVHIQYSQRHSVVKHCDRHITHLIGMP